MEIVLAAVLCGGQICVARRSHAVATGRGLWSVVTGYVEPGIDPLTQVWTELSEELGLNPPAIRLARSLEPVPLTSGASGKEFLVHPFLFECTSAEGVVLNWEHDDVQWVDASRLSESDCVTWQYPLVQALLHSQTGLLTS
jgi:ribose 1,5-bisphosphate isomerase